MAQVWRVIPDFPDYSASNIGYIRNDSTERIMRQYPNTRGTAMVGLVKNGVQNKRAISPIVAGLFLPKPRVGHETPINLDGDRFNNRVENLAWRPLWFARRYHVQFEHEICIASPIQDMDTKRKYENTRAAAVAHGLLEREIRIGIMNCIPVWPTYQSFRVI
jgi:hypothetical protein